ncbi:BTAD domain-containing putative transcriptional regulator [Sciscionella sediminilitoris]|uniref:BTAD domain-containing putative transcriptional regulator n=1 Tax=Sciscionella sediminilitoris TaxID=1445613 RepID=UPI0007C64873|nr:BTAD domain-containing putative transcriptional regulator [Sciscionella sp. SE31]
MRIGVLGPVELAAEDGTEIPVPGARLRALLIRLALAVPDPVPTDVLIEELWGGAPPNDAVNALQSVVSRLRKVIPAVESANGGYRLAIEPDRVDAHRFARLVTEGNPAGALELWRGEPLRELPFAATHLARLRELRGTAVQQLCTRLLERGRATEVLARLDEVRAEYPLDERLAALELRALHADGRTAAALELYERVRAELAERLGADPGAELAAAHLAVLRGETPKRSVPISGRPPGALTSFVGRTAELAEVRGALSESRLVSLAGPGGAGKTRLAGEFASALAEEGSTVWFVPLAPVGAEADLAQAVLSVVDRELVLPEAGQPNVHTVFDRLIDVLGGREGVLVLDNCEHLIEAAAGLSVALLAACPRLRLLATSREPLAVTGERLHWLGPLSESEAQRLFRERALAARPGAELDAETVTRICASLDGMPLALELAAARLRSMTAAQVAERLGDRFRLLSSGDRSAAERHRTLRAVVDWSWDLLDEPERMLARRFSVFANGARAETVAAVTGMDVDELLSSLVEKSLLVLDVTGDVAAPRYRMLETIKAYAGERLDEAGEREADTRALIAHYIEMLEDAEPRMRTAEQLTALRQVAAEQDNALTALRAAIARGESESAGRLVMALLVLWSFTGFADQHMELVRDVLATGPDPDRLETVVLRLLAHIAEPDPTAREREIMTLLDRWAELGGAVRFPFFVLVEPVFRSYFGDTESAFAAIERFEDNTDPWVRACCHLARCIIADNSGDAKTADEQARLAVDSFRRIGERWGLGMALGALSDRLVIAGKHEEAIDIYQDAIRLGSELGSNEMSTQHMVHLARVQRAAGRFEPAEQGLLAVLERSDSDETGMREVRVAAHLELAQLGVSAERAELAREHLGHAEAQLAALSMQTHRHTRARLGTVRARYELTFGDPGKALDLLSASYPDALSTRDMAMIGATVDTIAAALAALGHPVRAAETLGASTAVRGTLDLGDRLVIALVEKLSAALGEHGYREAFERGALDGRDAAFERVGAQLTLRR